MPRSRIDLAFGQQLNDAAADVLRRLFLQVLRSQPLKVLRSQAGPSRCTQ